MLDVAAVVLGAVPVRTVLVDVLTTTSPLGEGEGPITRRVLGVPVAVDAATPPAGEQSEAALRRRPVPWVLAVLR